MKDHISRIRLPRMGLLFCLSVVLSVFAASGCSDEPNTTTPAMNDSPLLPPTDLSFDPADVVESDPDQPQGPETGRGGRGITHWHRSQLIKADKGGKLSLSRSVKLDFPKNALEEDTRISADVWFKKGRGRPKWIIFDFSPSPMQFMKPVKLELNKSLADALFADGAYYLWYRNPETHAWELVDCGEIHGDKVTFEIDHFSKFALSRGGRRE